MNSKETLLKLATTSFEEKFKDGGYQYGDDAKANARGWFKDGYVQAYLDILDAGFGLYDIETHEPILLDSLSPRS